jgi:ATP phosphoribosyltransferase regulatory subunit
MVYQPPAGARDLLPLDVAQKSWIEERLQQVFHRWGYHRIITSTIERMDTLMAGGAIPRQAVIQLQNPDQEELGLRPEMTASIARAAVTRMAGATLPQRLYYNANVFQRSPDYRHNQPQEFYQAGVELLGSGGLLADAEVLFLIADCLQALCLNQWHLILGEAGITRSLLDAFPSDLRSVVRNAIAHLDLVTIENLPLSESLRQRARTILDLRGHSADVIQKINTLDLDPLQQQKVNNLKSLLDLLAHRSNFPLILDLSLIQTFDYYTGIAFEVVSNTKTGVQVVGRGGRYDRLLALYHPQGENIPGIGFTFFLENLYQAIADSPQLPQSIPATNWLVVAENSSAYASAFAYARKLRDSSHLVRVEMDLGGRSANEIRQYARDRCIAQIAWVKADGSIEIESTML